MNLKGNNAQTYPYSAFILKREFLMNVRQAEKFLPNTKWQKKPSSSNNLPRDQSKS